MIVYQDTNGRLPVVHIDQEALDIALEVQKALNGIRANGGEGVITTKVSGGRASWLEYTVRRVFGQRRNKLVS